MRLHKGALLLALTGVVFVVDRVGKSAALAQLAVGERAPLLGSALSFARIESPDAALGLFAAWPETWQPTIFAVLSVLCAILVMSFYRGLGAREFGSAAALGAILGGVVSNAYDRISFGVGIEFLHLGAPDAAHLPDFNVADLAIILGVVTLIVELLAHEMATRVQERPRR